MKNANSKEVSIIRYNLYCNEESQIYVLAKSKIIINTTKKIIFLNFLWMKGLTKIKALTIIKSAKTSKNNFGVFGKNSLINTRVRNKSTHFVLSTIISLTLNKFLSSPTTGYLRKLFFIKKIPTTKKMSVTKNKYKVFPCELI